MASLIRIGRSVDSFGMSRDRLAIKGIQRSARRSERMAAALEKRHRKNAKRAGGHQVIILNNWPHGGVHDGDPPGCYVQGGAAFGGKYQMVIVGDLCGTVDDYRRALEAWRNQVFKLVSSAPLATNTGKAPKMPILSLILEPEII